MVRFAARRGRYTHGDDNIQPPFYLALNKDLRRLSSSTDLTQEMRKQIVDAWSPMVTWMLSGCMKLTEWEGVVFRGRNCSPDEMQSLYTRGRVVVMSTFTSCSTSADEAWYLAGEDTADSTLLRFHCRSARNIAPYSCFPSEREIVLLPGSTYVVSHTDWKKVHNQWRCTINLIELERETLAQ